MEEINNKIQDLINAYEDINITAIFQNNKYIWTVESFNKDFIPTENEVFLDAIKAACDKNIKW